MRSSLFIGLLILIALAAVSMILLPFWVAGFVLVAGFIALIVVAVVARGAAAEAAAHPRDSIDPATPSASTPSRTTPQHDAETVADSSH